MNDEDEYTTEEESLDDEDDKDKRLTNVFGGILIFCFVSILIIFFSVLILVSSNDYVITPLYNLSSNFTASGMIPASFTPTFSNLKNGYLDIIPSIDKFWFICFLGMIASSVVYSYKAKRVGYFNLLSMIVFTIILLSFVGGIFATLSTWFNDNVMVVFSGLSTYLPFFYWYLSNVGIINSLLIAICILANFIDLDELRYNSRKDKNTP
jgi:hypothetical protein